MHIRYGDKYDCARESCYSLALMIPRMRDDTEVRTPMFFSSRSARILSAHSDAGSMSGALRYSRSVVSAAFLRTKVFVVLSVRSLRTSDDNDSENSFPPTLQIEWSAYDISRMV